MVYTLVYKIKWNNIKIIFLQCIDCTVIEQVFSASGISEVAQQHSNPAPSIMETLFTSLFMC